MKKNIFAVFGLSAIMTLSTACMTALAAQGWVQEANGWAYYNAAGNRITNEWRKGGDDLWRYVDSDGYMAVNKWVDNDDYYVDQSGIMASNTWLKTVNNDGGIDWYYFTSSGRAMKEEWEKIDGSWYYFDSTGVMQTGWVDEDMYYCGADGKMLTGWQKLLPPADYADDDEDYSGPFESVENDGMYWYYFSSSGKKVVPDEDSNDNIKQKKINGVYYCLREDGAMQTGWTCVTGDDSDNIEDYRFVDPNGQVRTGWYSAEPPADLMSRYDHDVEWFYFNNRGVPEVGPSSGSATTRDLKRIGGNTYLFDENGVPVYGLQRVFTDEDNGEYTAYYFGTRQQSSMLKGTFTLDDRGDNCRYYFTSTGRGYTGVHDGYLYYMGKVQKASEGSKYEVFTIWSGNNCKNYVVNTSGKIAKNTTVKDNDKVKYKTNSSGILLQEDDEDVDGNTYSTPEEPDWDMYD